MNPAPCGKKRLRYGHRFMASLLLLVGGAGGIGALEDVQHRDFWLVCMLGCGALALLGAAEVGLTDDGYELTRAFGLWHRCYSHAAPDAWATGSVPNRYGKRSMVWIRFRDGATVQVDSSDTHFFAQLPWQLNRRAPDLEVAPGAISFAARLRAIVRITA